MPLFNVSQGNVNCTKHRKSKAFSSFGVENIKEDFCNCLYFCTSYLCIWILFLTGEEEGGEEDCIVLLPGGGHHRQTQPRKIVPQMGKSSKPEPRFVRPIRVCNTSDSVYVQQVPKHAKYCHFPSLQRSRYDHLFHWCYVQKWRHEMINIRTELEVEPKRQFLRNPNVPIQDVRPNHG